MEIMQSSRTASNAINHIRNSFLLYDQETPSGPIDKTPANIDSEVAPTLKDAPKFDKNLILMTLEEKGLIVPEPPKPQLFLTCSELENGDISQEQLFSIVKALLSNIPGISPCLISSIDAYQAINRIADQLKAANAAENLRIRYLSGFETAKSLAPESVKIVVAVKEVVENTFDDYEVIHLQADSLAISDFLREETIPFLQEAERRGTIGVPIQLIRRKRAELKEKLEVQRRNVNIHLQRVEGGIREMEQET
jgi:hypothetical protein